MVWRSLPACQPSIVVWPTAGTQEHFAAGRTQHFGLTDSKSAFRNHLGEKLVRQQEARGSGFILHDYL
jgi:hypothetical protein